MRVSNSNLSNRIKQTPTDFQNLSGLSLCFLRMKFCLPVGETCGLPRAFDERPDKQISAEMLFSLPICVIMGLTKSLPCVKGGAERMRGGGIVKKPKIAGNNPSVANATAPFTQGSLWTRSFFFRGIG